jgi:hypothetical protein
MFLRAFDARLRALAACAFFDSGARGLGSFRSCATGVVENTRVAVPSDTCMRAGASAAREQREARPSTAASDMAESRRGRDSRHTSAFDFV